MADDTDGALAASSGWRRNAFAFAISREDALWQGHANDPTDAELAKARADIERWHEDAVAAWRATKPFLDRVEEITAHQYLDGKLLTLHALDAKSGDCTTCGDEWGVTWPCATARLVLTHRGIPIPDRIEVDEPVKREPDPDNPIWPFPGKPIRILRPGSFVQFPTDDDAKLLGGGS